MTTIRIEFMDSDESETYEIMTEAPYILPQFFKLVNAFVGAHRAELQHTLTGVKRALSVLNQYFPQDETGYLLHNPKNAERLTESIKMMDHK